jgi:hypothetical protein
MSEKGGKSAKFAESTKQKELAHRLPKPFADERSSTTPGADNAIPTQRQFGGKFIPDTPDEDLKMKMKQQFASDEKQLGHTMIEDKDYQYMIKKYKDERYLKALNFYDRIFDLRDPYQVNKIVKRVGQFQRH